MRETLVYGPPGCGKTTYAARQIAIAVEKYGPDGVLVCSHTRAAAREIASRDITVDERLVGTLHSLCFHALGRPELAEPHIAEFNEEHPSARLSSIGGGMDEPQDQAVEKTTGDALYQRCVLARALMLPRDAWTTDMKWFGDLWKGWKIRQNYCDFTDLIELVLRDFGELAGNPFVAFIDEAQDLSTLQFALINKWMRGLEHTVLLGDDDQCLYNFSGARPENLFKRDVDDKDKIILSQSYRLPRAVHALAEKWIKQCSARQAKVYKPRDAEGEVRCLDHASWKYPDPIIRELSESDDSVMILASCSYMLTPLIEQLRAAGIPFWNPYRPTRGDWNPLRRGTGSTAQAIHTFMAGGAEKPDWRAKALAAWVSVIAAKGILKHGSKKKIIDLGKDDPTRRISWPDIIGWFEAGVPDHLVPPDRGWLMSNISAARRNTAAYLERVIDQVGVEGLNRQPRITIGTIHSIKGAEASRVYLFPDLSPQGAEQWEGQMRDSVRRQFYVGLTRSRDQLVLCGASGPAALNFD